MPRNESTPPLSVVIDAMLRFVDVFDSHRAKYALIGGIATGIRSRMRTTKDVDFLLEIPQIKLPGLLEECARIGCVFDMAAVIREWVQYGMTVLRYRDMPIDLMKSVLPIYHHVLERAEVRDWEGRSIRVARPEGLILLKLIASRRQDVADIEAILLANPGDLDLAYVEHEWTSLFDIDDARYVQFLGMVKELGG